MTTLSEIAANPRAYFAYHGESGEWPIVATMHRDSGDIETVNFQVMQEELSKLPEVDNEEAVTVERCGHWAVGWVDYLLVNPKSEAAIKMAEEFQRRLEDYPILDENALSEREYEAQSEAWDNWLKWDVMHLIEKELATEEVYDAIYDMDDDELREKFYQAIQSHDICWESDDQGGTINTREAALALLDELGYE